MTWRAITARPHPEAAADSAAQEAQSKLEAALFRMEVAELR